MLFIPKNEDGFSVDGNAIDKPDKINIQKHLLCKNIIKKCFGVLKKCLLDYQVFVNLFPLNVCH